MFAVTLSLFCAVLAYHTRSSVSDEMDGSFMEVQVLVHLMLASAIARDTSRVSSNLEFLWPPSTSQDCPYGVMDYPCALIQYLQTVTTSM